MQRKASEGINYLGYLSDFLKQELAFSDLAHRFPCLGCLWGQRGLRRAAGADRPTHRRADGWTDRQIDGPTHPPVLVPVPDGCRQCNSLC